MVCRVKQINQKTGVAYIYESMSYWDKEKRQPRNKRVCVGKLDADGTFIPSKRLNPAQSAVRDPEVVASAQVIGANAVLEQFSERLGLSTLLKRCVGISSEAVLAMAYYLVLRGGALSHCEAWSKSHAPELTGTLSSQRISELLSGLTLDVRQHFFKEWMKQLSPKECLCYDITSISSYSEANEYVRYGYNRDGEPLPQLNLAVLFGQNNRLPMYYQTLPGSINDVSTLENLQKTFKALDINWVHQVMDKGFYSKKNVDALTAACHKFTLSVPIGNQWVQEAIDEIYETVESPEHYHPIDDEAIYVHSRLYPWGTEKRRCYLHLYYNPYTRALAVDRFNKKLLQRKAELESGNTVKDHQEDYDTYFIIKTTPKRGTQVSYNQAAVQQYIKRYAGFQALLSSAVKDPVEALTIYRDKDVVEKCFDDSKNSLDMKRLRMHSANVAHGKFFVQFIALILLSALRQEMRATGLIKKYIPRELLEEMETLVKVKYAGKYGHILTEATKAQREILTRLNINLIQTA
jgi:transposase